MPLALMLDGAAVLAFVGHRLPLGLAIPEGVLLAAPLLVYGGIAFLALRTRSLGLRLGAAAVLLGLHAGLVALHTLCFVSLWSLPAPAALRLAHRWSPLIPLLQLVWVPLLASPLASLVRQPPSPVSRRSYPLPARRDILASRTLHPGHRVRPGPDRELPVAPVGRTVAPVAAADTMMAAQPEPVPSAPEPVVSPAVVVEEVRAVLVPASVAEPEPPSTSPAAVAVVPDLDEGVLVSVAPARPDAEPTVAGAGAAVGEAAVPVAVEPLVAVPVSIGDTEEEARPRALEAAPVVAAPDLPVAVAASGVTEPPLDPYIVARLFEPYGPLLSPDGSVLVDWTSGPDAAVVCAAPRGMSRDRLVRLASRLARALATADTPSVPTPVRRLSLRGPDGVVVLTPLDRGVLVAAARRPGALALLEVLSARVVPGPIGGEAGTQGPDAAPAALDIAVSGAIRVETPAASLDVLAPAGVGAESLGALAGRLLAAIADDGRDPALHTLGVDLGVHRLMVHPVHPSARPPRFVAVVGGPEPPGLLGRRTERAARTLREAS